jgi:outer membrane receptor protein involved in Fe transport
MKWGRLLLTIILLQLSLCGLGQTITYRAKNASLENFFSELTKQSGFVFFYNRNILEKTSRVTLDMQNVSLPDAMTEALRYEPLIFTILGTTIFVTSKPSKDAADDLKANKRTRVIVKGKITDSLGNPLSDASIEVKNKRPGTISNSNGDFIIQAVPGDTLVISSIGLQTREIEWDGGYMLVVLQGSFNPLNEVIVGGNMTATRRRAESTSITVINAKTLDILPVNNISEIYRGIVPGTNSFSTGDATEEATTLTIRGAGGENSISQIAVYVDGIEFAGGSGYLAALDKENIDRIEVLRGPASSALYGTGSNGGIVLVNTKHGIPAQDQLNFTASAGFIQSKWVTKNPFQQYYHVESVSGLKTAALTLGGSYQSNGPYLPGGGRNAETVYTGIRWDLGNRLTANITGRYEHNARHESRDPRYDTAVHPDASALASGFGPTKPINKDILSDSYIVGVNLSHRTTTHWTNNLTAGYTQNGNGEIPVTNHAASIPLQSDYYSSVNKITTVRYSNILELGNSGDHGFNMNLTSGAEYKKYYYQAELIGTPSAPFSNDPANENYGIFLQANPSYKNIYLTLGLRYDHNDLFKNDGSFNPRIGATTNFDLNRLIIKPRIAWGSGITPPSYTDRYGTPYTGYSIGIPNPDIKPQDQEGFDYGLEIFDKKNKFNFEVVYYNNRVRNMIVTPNVIDPGYVNAYTSANVGDVANTGCEFSGAYSLNSHFSLNGTFSIMNTIVKDSTGDYLSSQLSGKAPGFRLKFLPHHTAGIFLNYNVSKIFGRKNRADISLNFTELDGVYAFDGVRFITDAAYGRINTNTPNYINNYWIITGTVFQLGLNIDYYLNKDLRFFIQGSNIANNYKLEVSAAYPTYGASWMFGIKFNLARTIE